MTTSMIARVWVKWTAIDCFWVGRCGLVAGLLGAVSVYLFRPGTIPDEAAAFIVTPIAIVYVLTQLIAAGASRVETTKEVPDIEFRTKFLIWIMFCDLIGTAIGFPSYLVYKAIGIHWASDFAAKSLLIFVTSAFALGVMVGTDAVFIFEIGRRLLRSLSAQSRHHQYKTAQC